MIRFFTTLALLVGLLSCDNKQSRYKRIVEKYSISDIDFFGQVCSNHPRKDAVLARWRTDIRYFVEGNPNPGDVDTLRSVVTIFNALSLPVKIKEVMTPSESNLKMLFSKIAPSDGPLHVNGNTFIDETNDGTITYGKITFSTDTRPSRKALFMHEMLHALGLTGHCLSYSDDLLYPTGGSRANTLSVEDTTALSILYSDILPKGYTIADWEDEFPSALDFNFNQHEDLVKDYVTNSGISATALEEVHSHGMIRVNKLTTDRWIPLFKDDSIGKSMLIRYPKDVQIIYNSEIPFNLIDSLSMIIAELNTVTPNLTVSLENDLQSAMPGIQLMFAKDSTIPANSFSVQSKFNLFEQREKRIAHKSVIYVFYRTDLPPKPGQILGCVIYKALCLQDPGHLVYPFSSANGEFKIKPHYADILKFYYDPKIPPSLTDMQLKKLIEHVRQTETP